MTLLTTSKVTVLVHRVGVALIRAEESSIGYAIWFFCRALLVMLSGWLLCRWLLG
ncbi:MAG: hypothetical protein KAY06_10910 [Aeromonadaceae bacterium]|nr:hypothetical protein [Aeromonadaceae bacterium]